MDAAHLTDGELMRLIARGRPEALSELYDRYSGLVFSVAFQAVASYAIAEEITQDVFIEVWRKADTYRAERGKVSTWLGSVARHRAIDILRRQSVRPERNSVAWTDVLADTSPIGGNGTEEAAELAIERQRVQEAVTSLPREQKEALALAYFRGYSHSQIAEALDQPLGTVKTRIRLAMSKLREMLADGELAAGGDTRG